MEASLRPPIVPASLKRSLHTSAFLMLATVTDMFPLLLSLVLSPVLLHHLFSYMCNQAAFGINSTFEWYNRRMGKVTVGLERVGKIVDNILT